MKRQTDTRRFVGQNIKGTPAMSGKKVRQDLRQVRYHSDAYGLQEFKWPWYWQAMSALMVAGVWRLFPNRVRGLRDPIYGAQGLGWRRRSWRKIQGRVALLMEGGGLTTKRYIRAVLLQDPKTKLRCWHGSTHFQVGGDGEHAKDEPRRRLENNIDRLHDFLLGLKRTGYPIVFELDANIHPHTDAGRDFQAMVALLGGEFYGTLGVEYLFVIQGTTTQVVVDKEWIIPLRYLNTDHEGRGISYNLVGE